MIMAMAGASSMTERIQSMVPGTERYSTQEIMAALRPQIGWVHAYQAVTPTRVNKSTVKRALTSLMPNSAKKSDSTTGKKGGYQFSARAGYCAKYCSAYS